MKTVFVLGASSDIGCEACQQFLASGYQVIGHFNQGATDRFNKLQGMEHFIAVQQDLSHPKAINSLIQNHSELFETVDIFVNAAAFMAPQDYFDITEQDILKTIQVNFLPSLLLTQYFVPLMRKKQWGRILHLSSIGVKFAGGKTNYSYSLSKHMLEFLPINYKDWAADNVLVNVLRVGVTDTRIHANKKETDFSHRLNQIPMKRAATTTEMAKSIFNLSTEANTFMTGEIVTVAGGE